MTEDDLIEFVSAVVVGILFGTLIFLLVAS